MAFLEGNTIGIDLGTTYSALAQVNAEGKPVTIHNADDKPITPSVVLLGEDGHVLVGPSFERISIEDPSHIVEAIKRQMGNKDFYIVYQNKRLTPEFISALIMKKLKQDCEKRIGPIANAVITVPYYFNDIRRKATQDAGQDRRPECGRHPERADGRHAWPTPGSKASWAAATSKPRKRRSWCTTWEAERSTSRSCAIRRRTSACWRPTAT